MINIPTLWHRDPNSIPLPEENKNRRVISKGPLIKLPELQKLIREKQIDFDKKQLWLATPKCRDDVLVKYKWEYSKIAQMICALRPGGRGKGDYKKSEWAEVDGEDIFPCDVYGLHFDEKTGTRTEDGLYIYLKFSLGVNGDLILVLVSCHL
ncbi:hypothetical protein [Massilia sp. LC238]|uniref:hypothetical protein n=1 Tax=Massilia sp. LC238 TaxID=1502852 RepID=UPI001269E1FB|nr:hypothetical protein [Massilia sp. LC238]